MQKKVAQAGYTMIEAIAFLGVVAMFMVAIYVTINRMMDRYKISRLGTQIVELQKGIDYRFSSSESYNDITLPLLIEEKIAPSDMISNNKLYHTFAGPVTIATVRGGYAYNITFAQLSRAPCIELALQEWRNSHNSHLLSIRINGLTYSWKENAVRKLPLTLEEARIVCNTANRGNTIIWQFQ